MRKLPANNARKKVANKMLIIRAIKRDCCSSLFFVS